MRDTILRAYLGRDRERDRDHSNQRSAGSAPRTGALVSRSAPAFSEKSGSSRCRGSLPISPFRPPVSGHRTAVVRAMPRKNDSTNGNFRWICPCPRTIHRARKPAVHKRAYAPSNANFGTFFTAFRLCLLAPL